jgi:hypothetical protein
MTEPTNGTPRCMHFAECGEGVEWPIEISLEHFDDCLEPEQRLQRWEQTRDMVNRAIQCNMSDHAGAIEQIRSLQRTILAFIRVGRGEDDPDDLARVSLAAGLSLRRSHES